ncbi:amidohydrolase [Rufibacter glacialis]|uniref:Amidohydrolase n=1 Tax=Rufibacter glacialis TaxID=1259555 RepID=A0A5M8QJ59_9BACT|nr:amidohydrolase family protein [Rufibacter glacialis]KAA6434796.1 amidohydrolase family protein [Rufibacter glacialis]GGK72521.1 amidohydrolase [Rufibacter glacialis]
MARIDAHQHFWKFNPVRDSWITEEMAVIQRDFYPEDLEPVLRQHGFDGCVLVQHSQPEHENDFLLETARKHEFVKAVVGWVDLLAEEVGERLDYYSHFPKLKGFRYVLQGHPDPTIMLRPEFLRGIAQLEKYGFTYDVLIYPDQLVNTEKLMAAFPNQPFVIDHLAKPRIKNGELAEWKKGMQALARHENVSCKVSGMVTEADWQNWKKEDIYPYLDSVVEAFGPSRLLYGSDWPVCLVAASYERMLSLVEEYFSGFSQEEKEAIFGGNATAFYHLT